MEVGMSRQFERRAVNRDPDALSPEIVALLVDLVAVVLRDVVGGPIGSIVLAHLRAGIDRQLRGAVESRHVGRLRARASGRRRQSQRWEEAPTGHNLSDVPIRSPCLPCIGSALTAPALTIDSPGPVLALDSSVLASPVGLFTDGQERPSRLPCS